LPPSSIAAEASPQFVVTVTGPLPKLIVEVFSDRIEPWIRAVVLAEYNPATPGVAREVLRATVTPRRIGFWPTLLTTPTAPPCCARLPVKVESWIVTAVAVVWPST
jgi:hypothetical protein